MDNKNLHEKISEYEKRISILEAQMAKLLNQPSIQTPAEYSFTDRKKPHNELLEELLKSDYCHSKNGLTFDLIVEIFRKNNRPVDTKKLRDLLGVWKKRRKIEAMKTEGTLRYFWVENG